MSKLALIAGAGALPALIASRQPEPPLVACLDGFSPEGLPPHITFRIEHLGSTLAALKDAGVSRLCLVGKVARPAVDMAAIDDATRPMIPALMEAIGQGDDAALRGLISVLEREGFDVVGAHELAADLLPSAGILVGQVSEEHEKDATRGAEIIAAMGAADIGQACIVASGQALAVEALPGTDWMLRSMLVPGREAQKSDITDPLGMASDWLSGRGPMMHVRSTRDKALPPGGLLFKAPKPAQELRVDMPTIGPDTIKLAAECGLDGVVVQAGGVLVLSPDECRRIAEAAGIFLWVRA